MVWVPGFVAPKPFKNAYIINKIGQLSGLKDRLYCPQIET